MSEGEKYSIIGSGASNGRLWSTHTADGTTVRVADAGTIANRLNPIELTIGATERYLVFNSASGATTLGVTGAESSASTYNTRNLIETIAGEKAEEIGANISANISTDIAEINANLFNCNELLIDGYYVVSGEELGALMASTTYKTLLMPAETGDVFTVTGSGATSGRLWATVGSDGTIIRRADANAGLNNASITIADGESYFVFNANSTSVTYPPNIKILTSRAKIVEVVRQLAYDFAELIRPYSFHNNMTSDGISNLPNVKIYKNGIAADSNYGTDNARYVMDVGDYDKMHVFFRFKHTAYTAYSGSNVYAPLAGVGKNGALNIELALQGISTTANNVYRTAYFTPANVTIQSAGYININRYDTPQGATSIVVRYTGEETVDNSTTITAAIASGVLTLTVNGAIAGTVTLTGTDTIQTFANAINAIDGFACEVVNGDGTVADLLLDDMEVSLIDSVTRDDSTVYGTRPLIIPFALDSEWHTCEFVVDKTAQVAYAAYDGITRKVTFASNKALSDNTLVVGGNYKSESDIVVRDLTVDVGSWGDAEIVTGKNVSASSSESEQLISSHNPRLMIFEGHGIVVGTEKDAQEAYASSGSVTSGQGMRASTERLEIVFATLAKRGYEPVSMSDIIDWKKGKKDLPKRCYTCIFDDVQLVNYIDYNKRKPFVKHGVKPTLALITGDVALTDVITANGATYTVEDAINIIQRNGWYICSHTDAHRSLTEYTSAENETLLKADVLAADTHYIHSDVLVYPKGAIDQESLNSMRISDFAIGITIVEDTTNCKATSPYRLSRTELGTRTSMENCLAPFV